MLLLKLIFRRLLLALAVLCKLVLLAWGTLTIYWSIIPAEWLRVTLAAGFFGLAVIALFVRPSPRLLRVFAAAVGLVLVVWVVKRPSHDRDWRPEVAVLPTAVIDGDLITLDGVRNFDYRSVSDFTVRHESRQVRLSSLESVDFLVSHWGGDAVAHTFLSFNFSDAEPVCISIEARLEKGEVYSPIASCFKEAELIYIVGNETDLVRVRTEHRNERVYLYRTRATPEASRRLFLSYLEKINGLADKAEFYHLLSNNCTVNIQRHARGDGSRAKFDLRVLVNGYVAAYAYAMGVLDSSVPFPELRARSLINPAAQEAGDSPDFSNRIRAHLHPSQ